MASTRSVAVVSPLPPDRGGIAHTSARIVAALSDEDVGVTAIAWRRHYPPVLYPGESQAVAGPEGGPTRFVLDWFNPFTWWRAARLARGCDRVVFAWVTAWDALAYWTIARLSGTRCIAIVHNDEPHERLPFSSALTKLFLRRVDRAITLSSTVAGGLRSRWPWLEVVAAEHPASLSIDPRPAPPRPPLRLIHPGFIREYKGPDIAIEACAIARSEGRDVELLITGEGWTDVEELRSLAERLGVGGSVVIDDGYLSDDALVEAILDSHAVILPYRSASQSGLAPLAIAAGRPLIVTDVGGLVEQVDGGRNAVVAEEPTPPSVARAISELDGAYERLSGTTIAEPDAGWDRVVHAILD